MNIVDILIIGFLLMGSLIGYKRGLLGSIVGLFSSLIGLFVAYKYYLNLGQWFNTQYQLQAKVGEFLNDNLVLPQAVSQFEVKAIHLPNISTYLDKIEIPITLKSQLVNYLSVLNTETLWQSGTTLGDILHQYVASAIINGLSFLLIWFIVDRGIMLVSLLYSRVINNTVLGGFDRTGGLIIGSAVSVLAITIIIGVISPLLNMADMADNTLFAAVMKTLGESKLVPHFTFLFTIITDKVSNLINLA